MTANFDITNIAQLKKLGYEVAPSKTKSGKFRWWINIDSDGVSVPPRDCAEIASDDESAAWAGALKDAQVRGVWTVSGINQESVSDVVEHVREMGKKYGFNSDEDCVREQVEESANLLCIELNEEEIVAACDAVLAV